MHQRSGVRRHGAHWRIATSLGQDKGVDGATASGRTEGPRQRNIQRWRKAQSASWSAGRAIETHSHGLPFRATSHDEFTTTHA